MTEAIKPFHYAKWLFSALALGFVYIPIVFLTFSIPYLGPLLSIPVAVLPLAFLVVFIFKAIDARRGSALLLTPVLIVFQLIGFFLLTMMLNLTGHGDLLDIGAHIA
ncbi:MAG TPA: hypothetical protein VN042_04365 [Asticcacaulis sp.]|nr:hypothetical protein [Asticcacaulis sp.]